MAQTNTQKLKPRDIQVAHIVRHYGLTKHRAELVAALHYGEVV